jgi:hypothetical protein
MTRLTPQEMLNHTRKMADNIAKARRGSVAVGLPAEKVGGKVYGDGMAVIDVGAIHEYGAGNNPRRSFLRLPFTAKRDILTEAIAKQFKAVFEQGQDAGKALGLIGVTATNISKEAFVTRGYGQWPDIKQSTKNAKGSSQVLIDKGILRGSITYVVRGV